jgi:RNA polymerase sigma-70 factor (ECF subfamily)
MGEAAAAQESRLVEAARSGDRAAFGVLVREASPLLERLAVRLLGHRQDAEDVVQETILDAWKGLPRFRGEARFRTWTTRILIARAFGASRRRRPAEDLPAAVASAAAGPAADASSKELETTIREAIDDLAPVQRATLLLRADHGLSYDEIAYVLGSSRDAVRMNLIDARRRLAERLRRVVDLGPPRDVGAPREDRP